MRFAALVLALCAIPGYASADIKCRLGIVKIYNAYGPISYKYEVLRALKAKGYMPVIVDSVEEASSRDYTVVVDAQCGSNVFNPFMTSTTTTLTLIENSTQDELYRADSDPQIAFGTCQIEVESLIRKMPACR